MSIAKTAGSEAHEFIDKIISDDPWKAPEVSHQLRQTLAKWLRELDSYRDASMEPTGVAAHRPSVEPAKADMTAEVIDDRIKRYLDDHLVAFLRKIIHLSIVDGDLALTINNIDCGSVFCTDIVRTAIEVPK